MRKEVMLESLLTQHKEGLTETRIKEITNLSLKDIKKGISDLRETLKKDRNRGFKLVNKDDKYQLYPKFKIKSKTNYMQENKKVLNQFLEILSLRGRAESTIENYKLILSKFIRDIGKNLKNVDIEDLRNYLKQEQDKGNKKSTIATKISILKSLLGWMYREGIKNNNPSQRLIKPKLNKTKRKYLTVEEIERIRQLDMKLIDKVIFELLYSTGIRVSEAVNLNWGDIGFSNREVYIRSGKGDKDRVTFMSVRTMLLLKKYKERREDNKRYLLRSNFKKRMSKESIIRHIRILGEKANIDTRIHPHRLRHSFATRLLNSGVKIQTVQKLLGHSKISTTETYAKQSMRSIDNEYKRVNL